MNIMKRELSVPLAGFLCAFFMLNSCSGHIVRPTPAENEKESLPPVAAVWSEKERHEKSLVFSPGGRGERGGIPLSWRPDGKVMTLRFYPDCSVGRTYSFLLTRADSLPTIRLGGKVYVPYPLSRNADEPEASPVVPPQQSEEERLADEGQEAANLCFAQIGQKYKYGGKSPETGFDCSGLVWYVYSQLGYTLERVANNQAKQGILIEEEKMQPGDLLCFGAPGYVGHIGIYVGERYYIHAMGAEFGVVLTSLDDPYLKRTYEVRRIVGCEWLKSENVAAGMLPPEDA